MIKRASALALVIALLSVSAVRSAAAGWQDVAVTDWYTKDGGTEDAPYQISTAEQLAGAAKMIKDATGGDRSGERELFAGKHFVLTRDIDLKGEEWLPIGWFIDDDSNFTFAGTFDGRGHSVTGLRVTQISSDGEDFKSECPSLFGALGAGAAVRSLYVEGHVGGNECKGASLIAAWSRGEIYNCVASGDVIAEGGRGQEYGGVVAAVAAGAIKNVAGYGTVLTKHDATLQVMHSAGGLAGYRYDRRGTGSMSNCVSMVSSVKTAMADGAGLRTVAPSSALFGYNGAPGGAVTANSRYITGDSDRPGTTDGVSFTERELGTVPVVAALLDAESLGRARQVGSETEIRLALYPLGGDISGVTAEWSFDSDDVHVLRAASGSAVVRADSPGTKSFTVQVGGLAGFGMSEQVALRGEISFDAAQAVSGGSGGCSSLSACAFAAVLIRLSARRTRCPKLRS